LPSLLYELDSVSGEAHVDFRGMTRGSSTGSSPGATSTAGATSTSGVGAASLPPGAVVGTAGLATLPFTFDFSGSFFPLEHFLGGAEPLAQAGDDSNIAWGGRLLAIDALSLSVSDKNMSKTQAKFSATAYVAPDEKPPATPAASTTGASAPAVDASSG